MTITGDLCILGRPTMYAGAIQWLQMWWESLVINAARRDDEGGVLIRVARAINIVDVASRGWGLIIHSEQATTWQRPTTTTTKY